MHFNATPKSPLKAFIFTVISLIWLVGLPVGVTYAKKLPASLVIAKNSNSEVITWLNKYLKVHPNAPIQRNDWMAADRHITAAGPLWSYAGSQSVVTFGVACALCTVEAPANAIDGNVNTAATMVLPAGAVGGVGLKLKFPGSYLAGDRIALDLEIPDQVLSLQLLSAISITTFNGGVANNDVVALDNAITRVDLLGLGTGSTPKFRVTIPVTKNFDEVQVNLSAIVAGFGSLLVYEATAFIPVTVSPAAPSITSGGTVTFSSSINRIPDATFRWYTSATGGTPVSSAGTFTTPALKRSTTYYVEATSPTDGLTSNVRTPVTVEVSGGAGPLWSYGDQQQSPITGGIACALCYVDDPGNAVDADTTTFSRITLPLGALTSVGQLLEFPGGYKAGDNIILDLEIPGQTLSVGVLGGIQVQTFNGAAANNDAITLSAGVIHVDMLGLGSGTSRKFRVTVPVTKDFDRVQVSLTTAFAAFGALNIYEAAASIPVTVTPGNPATTAGGSVSLTASVDARVASPVFKWYTDAQGGTPIATSGTFATPALNRTTTYYVEAYAAGDNLSSYTRTPVTIKVAGGPGTIWSFGQDEESPVTGGLACVGCLVSNPLLAADGDTTTASTLTIPLGIATTVGQLVKLPGVYQAGDSIVLFLDSPSQDLAAVLLPKVKVTTYNNSIAGPAVSNNDAVTLNSSAVSIKFLGAGLNNSNKYRVTVPATKTFDGVQVDFGGLAGVAGTLDLYEVAAMIPVKVLPDPAKTAYNTSITLTPSIRITNPTFNWYTTPTGGTPVFSGSGAFQTPALIRNTNYYVEAEDPAGTVSLMRTVVPVMIGGGNGPLWTYGTAQQSPVTGGIACALCTVQNPQFAVDGDTSSASLLSLPLGVATTLGQKISFPGVYHSGDSIIFILGTKGDPIADASLLGAIKVTTSLNNVSNNDGQLLNGPLLNLQLLSKNSISKFRIAVPVSKTFDAAQIDISSLLAADNTLYVFEAAAMTPVTVTPSSASITAGQTATFAATLPSIPGAIFNWYETKTGGAPVYTGSSFTTPPLYQDKTYYIEAVSPTDGLISIERTGVSVSVTNTSGNGALSCSGAKTQNNGVIGICLLCGISNAGNAIDNLPATASSLRTTVGLGSTVYQDLVFAKAGKAGDTVRIGLGNNTGLLDVTLLAGISVGLGNGSRPADADMTALSPQLLGLRLLSGVQQSSYAFVATKAFDRVEIRVNGLLTAVSTLNVYYAQIVTPIAQVSAGTVYACSGTSATLSAVGPNGYNFRWYSSYTGGTPVGYGATFTTPVITKDTTYFVETAGTDSCGSETRIPVQVKLGLPSVNVTPSSASVAQSATPTFNVVSPNAAYKYNWYTVPTGGTPVFVGSQFTTPPVTANVTYYAEAVNASNTSCKSLRTPVSVTLNGNGGPTPPVSDIDCGGAASQQTTTSGICIGCYVEKQDSAVDNSTQTASVMHTILGVGSYVQQSLIFSAAGVKGDSVRIKLGFQIGLADLSVLSGIQVSSSNAGTANNDAVTLAPELLNLKLINGNRGLFFTFAPAANFDRVNIRLNGLATALTALKVYSAQIFAGTPTVEKDTVYMCLGGSATMKATGPGTSFRWYNQPTGGTVLATGATYTVSATTNAIYYVEAVSGSGCTNPVRKAVYVMVGLPQPLVSPSVQTINSGQTATFTVSNPNPAYQYNWYNVPVGGTVLKANATTYTTAALTAAAVYYVEVKDPANNCTSPTRTMVRVDINLPTEPTPCSYATQQQSPVISGVCLLCSVSDAALAVDQNTNSASTINATISAAGYVGQLLQYAHTYPAGDSITLDLEVPGQLVNAALLGGIRIETYNNSTANGDAKFLNNGLIRLALLNTGNRFRVTIPTAKTFNGVIVSINGLLTALTSVKVYFAAVVTPRPVVAATNVNTCSGTTATLTATSPNAVDIAWYTDAVGGTAVGTGGQFITPVLTSSVTYYAEAGRFGCANPTRVPVTVNVGTTPVAPTAASRSICTGSQITLLATAPPGVTFRWYTAATGGMLLASAATYTTNALTADTAFYVESDNNGCKSVTRTRVKVTVSAAPTGLTVTPLGTSVSSGQGALFTASATGTNIRYVWYNAAGDSIFNAAVFNTGPLTATTTYSVEAVNAGGCKSSARAFVTATVIPGGNDIPCDAATSETNTANGICLGCSVQNPALAVDNSTSTSSTLHVVLGLLGGYVQQTLIFPQISELNDSIQIRLSFDASVADVGLLSTIQIGSYNGATSNNDFVALNNTQVKVTLLSGNQQAMIGFKPKGLFDRIVVRLNSGLVTAISSINVHYASRLVGLPVVKGDTVCSGGRATLTASGPSNVTFRWYTTATGGTSIFTGSSYQTPALTATTTFYAEALKTSLTCPNPQRVPVIAVVDPVPDAPALDTTALTICSGSKATFNVKAATGVVYRWYTTLTGGTAIFTGASFTTPSLTATTVYYVEASNTSGCSNTTRTRVTANVTTQPPVPVITPAGTSICAGNSTQLVATSATPGLIFRWYTTATGGTAVFEGATFNTPVLNNTTTYYVETATGACTSSSRVQVTVTVNAIPAAPTVTTVPVSREVVSGQSATLTASSVTPGVTYNWYTTATGGSPVFTGAVFQTPVLTSSITYYAEAVAPAGGCPGTRTAVTLTVTVVPNTDCDFANAQTSSTTAICLLCTVENPTNTIDVNTDNFSSLTIPLSAGNGSVQQMLIFPQVAAAGDSVRIVMELPAQVIDASLLGAVEVSSFNGATANNDAMLLNSGSLSVKILSGSTKFTVAFAPGAAYDRVQVRLRGGVISALLKLNIYYASRQVSAPVVAVRNVSICSGTSAVLTATASSVAKLEWYDAPVGGTRVADGATFTTPILTATKTYYVQSVRSSNNCVNANRVPVTVSVVPSLVTPTVNNATICSGNQATLTATVTALNVQIRWYSAPTGGTLLFTGPTYITNVLTADTAFYVETSNGTCSLGTRVKANVTVGAGAPTPTLEANNVNICEGTAATFRVTSNTTGITYKWYATLTGGTALFTGPVFVTPLLSATTVYYVEALNTTSQCNAATARVQVTANVSLNPVAPVVVSNSVQVCMGQNAVLAVQSPQTGLTYQWYTALTGGTLAASGSTFTVQNVTTDADYYVQAVNSNGCANAGGRVKVSVIAAASPGTPAVTAASVNACQGNTAVLSVQNPDGTLTYRWYSAATGGTSLGSGSSFTTPVINTDTDFYVEASNGNCSSAVRARVSVLVATAAPVPTLESNNVSTCTGSSAVLRVTSSTAGITYNWYTTATGGTAVFTGPEFTTPLLTSTTIYYVEAVNTLSQCGSASARASATVTVGQSPDAPTLTANSVRGCAGKDVMLAIQNPQTGITYQWFDAATGGTLVFTGIIFNVPAVTANVTYYVQAARGTTCVSASRATVSILVDAAAPTPDVVSANLVTCVGGTATLDVLNPDATLTYRWYDAPAGGNLLSTGAEYTTGPLSVNTTFYVEALNSTGCSSQARKGVTVTIVNSIDAPLAPGATVCSGRSAVLSVTSPQAGISYKWYTAATGGTPVFTGANFTTSTLTANTTYYVEAATGGCVSQSRTIVPVTVNSTPTAPVVANASVTACLSGTATLEVQNPDATLTYRWYDSPTEGTLAGTGAIFTTGAIGTNRMYYVEALNATGCSSIIRTAVSVTIESPSDNVTVTGNEAGICPGESATLTAASITEGAEFRWYTDATGGAAVFTGSTFETPSLSASTTYYVEVSAKGGCTSTNRVAVPVTVLEVLATPVVTVDSTTVNAVTFSWAPITGATAYEVTLDDGITYSAPSSGSNGTSHTVAGLSPDQSVTIRVRALGGSTCETSALSVAVTGKAKNPQGNKIFVPNVFTPNGDGFNDVHYIYGNTIASVVIRYYNQFGQLIYETKDQRKGWDGTVSGRPQPVGVYIYVLRATLQDGSVVNMKGTITIVR
ncbi:T9SS type B sorting domain-containing protein [Chitinophaga oryziterrae]|uniref:T9SS type B sorting domain-containing protein n=1 Tax=Chitinophaga oryziterrae TaxID=1031224 RepID=A0A6N8JDR1_9BACT|nr:gliding motility-associated C-terminal domain-containing protein [Chitinophaga oryziterrae]MVT42601.1 T9SS type B sorting domain-containing protein [Chitinophaga oryziterrae]